MLNHNRRVTSHGKCIRWYIYIYIYIDIQGPLLTISPAKITSTDSRFSSSYCFLYKSSNNINSSKQPWISPIIKRRLKHFLSAVQRRSSLSLITRCNVRSAAKYFKSFSDGILNFTVPLLCVYWHRLYIYIYIFIFNVYMRCIISCWSNKCFVFTFVFSFV